MGDLRVRLQPNGPLFDYSADMAVEDLCRDIRSELATQGLVGVMAVLASPHPQGIRERTPYYETRLNIMGNPSSDDTLIVNDDDVVYGPWLAGVGSRNYPVTPFKGYDAWRKSFARLARATPDTLARLIGPHLRRMN